MADFSRLPGPNADLWDWQLVAACRGVDSSLFFHPEGERGAARSAREAAAKEVCMRCPVRAECAAHALAVREPYGVWGGLTEDEREAMMGRSRHRGSDHRDEDGDYERATTRSGRSRVGAAQDDEDDEGAGYGHRGFGGEAEDTFGQDDRDDREFGFEHDYDPDLESDRHSMGTHPMDEMDFAEERDWDSLPVRPR